MATASLRQQLFQTAARRLTPLAAHLDLTYRCNFRCTHCYIPEHGGPELSTAQIFQVLDDLARTGTMFLVLSGGEVFLRRDLFEILAYARRLGFLVRLFTDGYFVDARNADRLAQHHVAEVHVSLYSTDAARFDEITQVAGSFDRVLRGVDHLRARGLKVVLKAPLLRPNARDAAALHALAVEKGCEIRFDASVIPQRDGCADPVVQHGLDDAAMRSAIADLLTAQGDVIAPYEPGTRDEFALCGAGRSTVHIEPSGQVNPCVILPMAAGNVHERPLSEIWRDSPVLQQIRGYKQKDRDGCRGCMNMGFCSFCMGRAFLSTGDPLAPAAVMCNQTKARADLYRAQAAGLSLDDLARPLATPGSPWEQPSLGHAAATSPVAAPTGLVQLRRPAALPSPGAAASAAEPAAPSGPSPDSPATTPATAPAMTVPSAA